MMPTNGHIGFTGTQVGMTVNQLRELKTLLLTLLPTDFHHGDCIGADAQAHDLVLETIPIKVFMHIHPPDVRSKRAFKIGDDLWPEKPYLVRNHDIVDATTILIATPKGPEELRSGTWATIRYARKQKKHIYIVYPDGVVKTEGTSNA
jgi:hypothetical protein